MPFDHFIGEGKQFPGLALTATPLGLGANAGLPFIPAGGRVAAFSRPAALPAPGIHVLPASEQGSKQGNLLFRRAVLRDPLRLFHRISRSFRRFFLLWQFVVFQRRRLSAESGKCRFNVTALHLPIGVSVIRELLRRKGLDAGISPEHLGDTAQHALEQELILRYRVFPAAKVQVKRFMRGIPL